MQARAWMGWGLAALLGSGLTQAGVTPYQSNAAFQTAIAGLGAPQTTNFDAIAVGTQYTSGSGLGGFTLTASASGGIPLVNDKMAGGSPLWTTSGTHFLGLNNAEAQFIGGDALTFNFGGSVRGFGLYVITGSDVQAGDLGLSDGTNTVFNGGVADLTDAKGSFAYFLGLVSDANLGALTLSFGSNGYYAFTAAVDDVTLVGARGGGGGGQPVPEPATWALLGLAGLAAVGGSRRTGQQSASVLGEKELQS